MQRDAPIWLPFPKLFKADKVVPPANIIPFSSSLSALSDSTRGYVSKENCEGIGTDSQRPVSTLLILPRLTYHLRFGHDAYCYTAPLALQLCPVKITLGI